MYNIIYYTPHSHRISQNGFFFIIIYFSVFSYDSLVLIVYTNRDF